MIVKNEENNIERCLNSVKNIVDEIVIVDTGSSDQTIEKAEAFGAKIYHFDWENDFAAARNYSLSKAGGDWLLLLDADEEFERQDADQLIAFLQNDDYDGAHFIIHNYMSTEVSDNCTVHNGLRLLRNNRKYEYTGEIHEQITRVDREEINNKFPLKEIRLYHYGYMDSEVQNKQKRKRNIPILEKQLQRNPEDAFTLFNLGNEYLAMNDCQKALEIYFRASAHLEAQKAFTPHLLFRMIYCFDHLKQYENALIYSRIALDFYPASTDLKYAQASVYYKLKRYTLAIEGIQKCLEMGDSPSTIKFITGCGDFRAACTLGEIYFELEDYEKALYYFSLALNHNPHIFKILGLIGKVLNKLYEDKTQVWSALNQYFADPDYPPNFIFAVEILFSEKLYQISADQLNNFSQCDDYPDDFLYLNAKSKFFLNDYTGAYQILRQIFAANRAEKHILPAIKADSAILLFVCDLLLEHKDPSYSLAKIRENHDEDFYLICRQLSLIATGSTEIVIPDNEVNEDQENNPHVHMALMVLDKVLKAGEFVFFEKLLPVLNLFDSKTVLLQLARVYYQNQFGAMAVETVLQSIKEFNCIDIASVQILFKELNK